MHQMQKGDRLNLEEKEILRAAIKPQLEPIYDYDLARNLKNGVNTNNNNKDSQNYLNQQSIEKSYTEMLK